MFSFDTVLTLCSDLYQVLFDTSKKEMLNPNQGFKKFVMKLKQRYTVSEHKTNLSNKHGGLFFRQLLVLSSVLARPKLTNLFSFLQCTVNKQDISMESLQG